MIEEKGAEHVEQRHAKAKIYDSVFTDLFSDPQNQLKAYQALHPEDTQATVDDIRDVTLKATMLNQMYNDLGFTVGNRMIILVEDQSSWSENIAIRSMMYLAQTFEQYLKKTKQNYYGQRAVKLPKPELYMLYIGDKPCTKKEISLADVHWDGDSSVLDVRVKVIYGEGTNTILSQYAAFSQTYRKNTELYGRNEEAVIRTIDECIAKDVLKEYLKGKRMEVIGLMLALFDSQEVQNMYEESIKEEGRAEGRVEGEIQGMLRTLWGLVKDHILTKEEAAKRANLTTEEFEQQVSLLLSEPESAYQD